MDPLAVAIRLGLYLDLMLLFGGAAFRLHALLRESAEQLRGSGGTGMFITALLGLALSLLGLVALAASMSGAPLTDVEGDAVTMLLRETSVGTAGIVRLQALIVAAFFSLFWRRWPRNASLGVLLGAGTALATLAWSGHGAMDEGLPGWLHLGADIVHLLAAGIWVGALAALLALALRGGAALAHLRRLHDALERFSTVGIAIVLLLVLSGFANILFLTGAATLAAILTSAWSWLLFAKLVLFAAMLLLAAINRFRLTPQLAGSPDAAALRHARLSLSLESAAALLILLLVAWLGMLEPPISTV
ncbi:MAG: copper homeostasis membrane protein CopD [Sphingobium sp.]|nr:copper homeostasis membrane protein CopD [Sphingobium sp.]